jgi:hypothetical protein
LVFKKTAIPKFYGIAVCVIFENNLLMKMDALALIEAVSFSLGYFS